MVRMMNLEEAALHELDEEKQQMAVYKLKERIQELNAARRILDKLEKRYQDLLGKDVDDVFDI